MLVPTVIASLDKNPYLAGLATCFPSMLGQPSTASYSFAANPATTPCSPSVTRASAS